MAACSSSSDDSGPDCRFNEAWQRGQCTVDFTVPDLTLAGGIWRGTDSSGRDVVMFTETLGAFQFVDGLGRQGAGFLAVGDGDTVSSRFELYAPREDSFADQSSSATCTFTGTIVERQSLTMVERCTTRGGLQFQESLNLAFDNLYDKGSSMEAIAGVYETPTGTVLNIASDGAVFAQDAVTGCVLNGLVSINVAAANLYRYRYDLDGCTGPEAIWNGSNFNGLAVLDDTKVPEVLSIAVIGETDGITMPLFTNNDRI